MVHFWSFVVYFYFPKSKSSLFLFVLLSDNILETIFDTGEYLFSTNLLVIDDVILTGRTADKKRKKLIDSKNELQQSALRSEKNSKARRGFSYF